MKAFSECYTSADASNGSSDENWVFIFRKTK